MSKEKLEPPRRIQLRAIQLQAQRVTEFMVLDTRIGVVSVFPGDWVVILPDGDPVGFTNGQLQQIIAGLTDPGAVAAEAPLDPQAENNIPFWLCDGCKADVAKAKPCEAVMICPACSYRLGMQTIPARRTAA